MNNSGFNVVAPRTKEARVTSTNSVSSGKTIWRKNISPEKHKIVVEFIAAESEEFPVVLLH